MDGEKLSCQLEEGILQDEWWRADDFLRQVTPRLSEVIIVPKDEYRSHKEQ